MRFKRQRTRTDFVLWPFWVVVYYMFLIIFATLTAIVNLFAFVTSFLPAAPWKVTFFQGMIRQMAHGCFFVYHCTGIMRVELRGFEKIAEHADGLKPIIIANHPSLLDVFIFYLKIPRLTCIYKSSLRKTLIKAQMGEEIGFVSNINARAMIRDAAAKVSAGEQLLIFPEGTRTVKPPINPFRSGAAGIAKHTGVPLQTVLIYVNSNVLSKEQSVFKIPELPIRYILEVGESFDPIDFPRHQDLNAALEEYFSARLEAGPHA